MPACNSIHRLLFWIRPVAFAELVKKALRIRREPVQTAVGRFLIDPVSYFGEKLLVHGDYEKQFCHAISDLLIPGDTFIDLGAHEGYFSVMASQRVAASGRVIAIEPQARLEGVLRENLLANQCSNVEVLNLAIGDGEDLVRLSLAPDLNSGASRTHGRFRFCASFQMVRQSSLDRILKEHRIPRVSVLKIDIEGAELDALIGAREYLTAGLIEHIAIELHPSALSLRQQNVTMVTEYLNSLGYRTTAYPSSSCVIFSRVINND